jgi:lipopolysaccharide export LptBFGC system permease protein LptF
MLNLRAFFYILKSIFLPFLMCLIAFFSLIFVFQFLKLSQFFFQDTSSLGLILRMFSLLGISYLPLLLPFSLIFGLLFGHGKLSSQSEFTALASFGVSKMKLVQPAIFFTFICFFTCFNSIHTWGPNAKFQSRALKNVLKRKVAVTAFQPGVFLTQVPGLTMYAESQDSDQNLEKVFILNEKGRDSLQIFSNTGVFIKNSTGVNSLGLKLSNGNIYTNNKKDLSSLVISFKTYLVELFQTQKKSPSARRISNSNSKHIKRQLKEPNTKEETKIAMTVELYKRNMFALSCLFFLVIGSLFSLRLHNRSSKGGGFFMAIVISLAFWIMLFVSEFLASSYANPLFVYLPIVPCILFCVVSYQWIKFKSIN